MIHAKDKYDYYNQVKAIFEPNGLLCKPYKEINYGIQFSVDLHGKTSTLRIYESKKKGISLDLSQLTDESIKQLVGSTLSLFHLPREGKSSDGAPVNDDINSLLPIIGTDESGKGDFFGPLVVAGVYCDERTAEILATLGVKDCKLTSDKQVLELAIKIEQICPHAIIAIGNAKYNEMYEKSRNLNSIMGWAHATTIETILEKQPCDTVLADKFADDAVIKSRLKEKGKQVKLIQRTKAESHIAVAAASVIARARFLRTISAYEEQYGFEFGKGGASPKVIATGKQFIKEQGRDKLNVVAKMHFKTLDSIL